MCEKHKLEGAYTPKDFEEELYNIWEEKGYFKPTEDKSKKPYTIVIPPPNITGKLHMGHALDNTIQDILIRTKRMQGYNTLWLPGTDHAAIATEVKIVEKMKEAGITKEDIGREAFLERAWDWKKEYGGTIVKQLKKIGSSCDWSRERFTMDEGLSNAVQHVFIKLYDEGLIYKGKRMINWCPNCNTSISDAEVEYEEEPTHLWHIRYKVKDEFNAVIGRWLAGEPTKTDTDSGAEYTITNTWQEANKEKLNFAKIAFGTNLNVNDASSISTLNGAVFKLYRYVLEGESNDGLVDDNTANWKLFATSDGSGRFSFENLYAGEYRLVEVSSPNGYVLSGGQWKIVITENADGSLTISTPQSIENATAITLKDDTYYVYNEKVPEMPSTGSRGIIDFSLIGLILMAIGSFFLIINQREKI